MQALISADAVHEGGTRLGRGLKAMLTCADGLRQTEGRTDMVSPSPLSTLNSSGSTSEMQVLGLHSQDLKATHRAL